MIGRSLREAVEAADGRPSPVFRPHDTASRAVMMYSVVLIFIAVSGYEDSSFASVRALLLRSATNFYKFMVFMRYANYFSLLCCRQICKEGRRGCRAAPRPRPGGTRRSRRMSGRAAVGGEEAAEIKPQDLIRLIPSEGVFPVRSARHGRRFPFS